MELLSIIEFCYFWLMRSLLLLVILGALLNEEGIFWSHEKQAAMTMS